MAEPTGHFKLETPNLKHETANMKLLFGGCHCEESDDAAISMRIGI